MSLKIKTLAVEYFTTKSTDNATMEVDSKTATNRPQLKELIRKMLKSELKKLKLSDSKK